MREQIIKYDNLSGGVLCIILYELLYRQRRLNHYVYIVYMPFIILRDRRTVVKTQYTPIGNVYYMGKKIAKIKTRWDWKRKLVVPAATGAMSLTVVWLSLLCSDNILCCKIYESYVFDLYRFIIIYYVPCFIICIWVRVWRVWHINACR